MEQLGIGYLSERSPREVYSYNQSRMDDRAVKKALSILLLVRNISENIEGLLIFLDFNQLAPDKS